MGTSNVHYNLAAWSNATYALGARCSNAGNAYQVITAGTSTVAPTGTGASISPGGAAAWKWLSAIDFTSLLTWTAAFPTTLTQPMVALLWNNGTATTTDGVAFMDLNGHTTSATNTITIKCAPGESFRDTLKGGAGALAFNAAAGVSFTLPGTVNYTAYFYISDANVIFDGIQFLDPLTTSTSAIMQAQAGTSLAALRNCIFDSAGSANGVLIGNTGGYAASNCLFIDRQASATGGYIFNLYIGHNTSAVNCTFVAIGDAGGGIQGNILSDNTGADTTGLVFRNSIIVGYGDPFFISAGNTPVAVDHCLLSDAAIYGWGGAAQATDGGGNVLNVTAASLFVLATANFRLKAGSPALNLAVTDTGHILASDDIVGTARPQGTAWDIGAYEFFVASLSGPRVIWFG